MNAQPRREKICCDCGEFYTVPVNMYGRSMRCPPCQKKFRDEEHKEWMEDHRPERPTHMVRHKFFYTGIDPSHDSDAEAEWRIKRGLRVYEEFSVVKECARLGYLGTGLIGYLEETGKVYKIYNGGLQEIN
jgi:hypothetical protein